MSHLLVKTSALGGKKNRKVGKNRPQYSPGTIKTELLEGFEAKDIRDLYNIHMRKDGIEPEK